MSDNILFPFPEPDETASESKLPPFQKQDEPPLSNSELRAVRDLLKGSKQPENNKPEDLFPFFDEPAPESTVSKQETAQAAISQHETKSSSLNIKQELLASWQSIPLREQAEIEARKNFSDFLNSISDEKLFIKLWAALGALFPLKTLLRHGTPEQKLFTLSFIGERFLNTISSASFNDRKRFIKIVGRYLSEISEAYSFISMEGESFNPQYHERIAGASMSGRVIREMRSFLITSKGGNQVVKLAQVLT